MQNSKALLQFRPSAGLLMWPLALACVAGFILASESGVATAHRLGQNQTRKTTDPPAPAQGKYGQDLFLAVDHRDLAKLKSLLKHGADPNSRNGLGFTPLYMASASHQPDAMKVLLAAGAKADADSAYGNALMFAAQSAHLEGANILISKGVDVNSSRGDGMTVLMMASASGMPPFVDMLIKHKANVNARADDGATALSFAAARGNTAAAQILIGSGAHINVSDRYKQTPLMLAANNGHADTVQLLLKAGANPNAKDFMGRTALMLASTYTNSADTVRALLAAGAHAGDKDRTGQTSCELAAARGNGACCAALGEETVTTRLPSAKQAISKSLALVQASMAEFSRKTACLSCHQEGLGRMATGLASAHGYKLDAGVRRTHLERINEALNAMRPIHERALKDPEALKQVPLMEINEIATTDTWLLAGMAAQHQAPTPASAAMTMVLARSQTPDGSWRFSGPRAPMQSSYFTFTALSIRALQTYGPKAHTAELASRIAKAKTWLLTAPVKNSEDRASKLLGLKWAGATLAERQQAIDDIRIDQRTDGGWAQLPNMASDAYATGQALYALHEAGGVAVDDSVYGRGVKYLLQTQDKDGSWYVAKRAMPNNNYFDAGFPHGESQYASFNGTCWAMMALLETLPQGRMTASR